MKLQLYFHPDSDIADYSQSIAEYESIWKSEGDKIVKGWEEFTGLTFQEHSINAIVCDWKSASHPLSLRFDYTQTEKRIVLVHELGHRLIASARRGKKRLGSEENHKVLFLILFDLLASLYGVDVADQAITKDKTYGPQYVTAWEWALSIPPNDRRAKFRELISS